MGKPHRFFYPDRDKYWAYVETLRDPNKTGGQLPDWAFDFISIHTRHDGKYRLLSCMKLIERIDPKRCPRPKFEDEIFTTKAGAVKRAKEIARQNGFFVVVCP